MRILVPARPGGHAVQSLAAPLIVVRQGELDARALHQRHKQMIAAYRASRAVFMMSRSGGWATAKASSREQRRHLPPPVRYLLPRQTRFGTFSFLRQG